MNDFEETILFIVIMAGGVFGLWALEKILSYLFLL